MYGSLASNPRRHGHPLRFELEDLHSARRGDHRILYRIDDERRLITIVAISHRANAYRGR